MRMINHVIDNFNENSDSLVIEIAINRLFDEFLNQRSQIISIITIFLRMNNIVRIFEWFWMTMHSSFTPLSQPGHSSTLL